MIGTLSQDVYAKNDKPFALIIDNMIVGDDNFKRYYIYSEVDGIVYARLTVLWPAKNDGQSTLKLYSQGATHLIQSVALHLRREGIEQEVTFVRLVLHEDGRLEHARIQEDIAAEITVVCMDAGVTAIFSEAE